MSRSTLCVVMPVYNEVAVVARVVDDVTRHVLDRVDGSELVVVDDHSDDGSGDVLAEFARQDRRIRVLTNDPNRGHGPSIRRGFDATTGEWILHVDSDGQLDLTEFGRLWALADDHDLVLGVRAVRQDPYHRRVLTRLTRWTASALAGRPIGDANTPFKLIRRSLYDHVAPFVPETAFAPTVAIVVAATRAGARLAEVDVTHLPRPHGRSTLGSARVAGAAVRSAAETVRVATRRIPPYTPETIAAAGGSR